LLDRLDAENGGGVVKEIVLKTRLKVRASSVGVKN
jgi:hypothetical protein